MCAYLKGFAVIAKVGADAEGSIASTSSSLTLTANTTDVTTKDDVVGGVLYPNEELQYKSAELKIDGYQKSDADSLSVDVGDEVSCEFTTGKRKYSFTGIVKTLEYSGDKDSTAGYSLSVSSKGAITKSAVS